LAAIKNQYAGDRLQFEWSPMENDTPGLWLTCGGWHGHYHFAIEPANAGVDALDLAGGQKASRRCACIRFCVPANPASDWAVTEHPVFVNLAA
jgi:hypothetical protein